MSDSNQQDKEMQSNSPKCECGYLKTDLEEGIPCPECGPTKNKPDRPRPMFLTLGEIVAFVSILMSALNCIFLSMHGFNYLSVLFYIFIILPTCFIAAVLIIVGAKRNEDGHKRYQHASIFIFASVFVTAGFLVYTLSNFNYWG